MSCGIDVLQFIFLCVNYIGLNNEKSLDEVPSGSFDGMSGKNEGLRSI